VSPDPVSVRDALHAALVDEMTADGSVLVLGEDVGEAGGVFQVTRGLQERFGRDRVIDTPISEMALAGAGFGAAITGSRPVVEIMFADFLALSMDSLINQAAKYAFVSGGQGRVPMVVRTAVGGGARMGAMHSQIPASWLLGVPGLRVVAPSDPASAYGLLRAAIRDDDPVVFMEHKMLYSGKGPPWDHEPLALDRASILREAEDLTIITAMRTTLDALEAARRLSVDHGIEAAVIDLRSLRPIDVATLATSVSATGRALVVEEGPRTGGWAAEVVAALTEACWGDLDDLWRLTSPDVPTPFSGPLEDAYLPRADAIVRSVLEHA
jgi:acetoin:2,6-dichlorophenolindophenol oxidoreductase subunit beta